jgi:uncharacterized protein YhaN
MNIHIEKITVRRDGPLAEDFELGCGELNLIYGQNESGKSYIVESLIESLFRTGGRGVADWPLRPWDTRAKAEVSGIDDRPVSFTPKGKEKLESRWQDPDNPLPDDLARLLVVKEGATWLDGTGATNQGVGINVLRNFLVGQKQLDGVQERISKTLRKASIVNGEPQGNQTGEIKDQATLKDRLADLDALVEECDQKSSEGRLVTLEAKRKELLGSKAQLVAAKRHEAFVLSSSVDEKQGALNNLASETQIGILTEKIQSCRKKQRDADKESAAIPQLQGQVEDYEYLVQAVRNYENYTRATPEIPQEDKARWQLPAAIACIAGMIIAGLMSLKFLVAALGVGAAALVGWRMFAPRKEVESGPVVNLDLEKLEKEYKQRFGEPVADLSSLQAKADKYNGLAADARARIEKYQQTRAELSEEEDDISSQLAGLAGQQVDRDGWDDSIDALTISRKHREQEIKKVERTLAALAIPEDQYLAEGPGHAWDAAGFADIEQELATIEDEIESDEDRATALKRSVMSASGIEDDSNWETLLEGLRQKRDGVAREYHALTAQVMAKILVHKVISELRENENNRIRQTLNGNSIAQCLQYFSRGYVGFHLTEDEKLEVEDPDGNTFPVSSLSSGAREQVFLSLRVGFASRALENRAGFLLLDDAFQHSDWEQRQHMVSQCLSLVKMGWQVFYFTMDDHLRDLFKAQGQGLGERFRIKELTRRDAG